MFIESSEAQGARQRSPILILDDPAYAAVAESSRLLQRSFARRVDRPDVLMQPEREAAVCTGSVILCSTLPNSNLIQWGDSLLAMGLEVYSIVICDSPNQQLRGKELMQHYFTNLTHRLGVVFPVFNDEISKRIDCDIVTELRYKAQGFSITGIVEAIEHMHRKVEVGDFDRLYWKEVMSKPGLAAATSLLHRPDVPVAWETEHIAERIFWPESLLNQAHRVLGRIEIPRSMNRNHEYDWRMELSQRFKDMDVYFAFVKSDLEEMIRVSLLYTKLELQKQAVPIPIMEMINNQGATGKGCEGNPAGKSDTDLEDKPEDKSEGKPKDKAETI